MELFEKRLTSGFVTIEQDSVQELSKSKVALAKLIPYLHLNHVQQLILTSTLKKQFSKDLVLKEFISNELVECVAELDLEQLRIFIPKHIGRVLAILDLKMTDQQTPTSLIEILVLKCRPQVLSWLQRMVPLYGENAFGFVQEIERRCLLDKMELDSWEQSESIQVLDSLLGSGAVNIDFFGHIVLQRATVLWIEKEFLDIQLFQILDRILDSDVEVLLSRTLLVVLCSILMDQSDSFLSQLLLKVIKSLGSCCIVRLALLPTLQALMLDRKHPTFTEILLLVEQVEEEKQEKIEYDLIVDPVYGMFVQLASSNVITKVAAIGGSSSVPVLKSLVFASQCLLVDDVAYKALDYFYHHVLEFRKRDALTILSLFMYLAQVKMEHYLFTSCIPQLTCWNDPFVTAAVLKFVQQLCEPRKRITYLERVGLEALLQVYKLQKRVWNHVKVVLYRWAETFKKSDRGRVKDDDELEIEEEMQIYVCELVLELCADQTCAKDLLAMIVSLLKPKGLDRHVTVGLEYLLDAFLESIQVGVTTPMAAWTVIFKSYVEKHDDSVVLVRFCRYIGMVATFTFDDVEKEVEFRNQMLGNLVPLLEHKDMTVCEAAFAALLLFPMEDVQQYIPPPSVLLSKGIYSDFLLQKIQLECRNMSRPVFKALSVEEGGKRTKEAEKDYHLKLSAMETQILSKTQNKQFIHALLFCIHSQDWKKDFLAFNEMVIQDVQFGEGLEGYTLFWTRVLKTQEPQKVIQEGFEMIVQKLTKAKTPSSTINFVLGGTGLALASLSLNVSTKWVHDWIETCRSKLDDKISRDIEGSLLLSLVRMIRFKKTFDVELATFVWNRCVGDGYLNAMCGARLLSIVANTERGLQWIKDYLERFYDGKWKTVGAAIGFSVLVKENPVYRDYVIEKVPEMIEDAYNLMAAAKRNLNDEIACCWILSCLDPLSHDLFASRLKMAVQNREEDLLPHLFKAYIRTASQGKYVEIQELLKVCVEYCESPHVAIKFAAVAGMQLLLGNDESFSISMPIVNSSDSLDLVQLGIKMLGETDQSRFGRALGFFVGNGIQRIQNRVSGLTGVVNGGDPMDYKRLNPEQSYLRACFDLLKNPRDEMEYLILKNIFFNVDCVLAPVDWSFLLETRTRDQVLEYFQFVIKQVDSKSAKCFIGFFLELINEVMTIYVQSRIDEYETVLFQGLEKLFDMVGLNGGSLIPVQQCWNVLESLIDSCLEIRWNDFGIRFTMKMKQSLQRADESDIKHTLCIKVIEYIEQLSEKVESNAIGLCIKNLAGSLATSPAEQDHFIHQMKDTERDLWAYGALLESRPELVHNFLLRYYQLIKLESKSAVYCLWYVFRTDNNSLKWFVDILDLMILKLNPEKIHFSKFLWNVGVSCLYGGEPLYECDWKCMNFNTILKLKKEVKQKSKLNQAIISRLTKLEQHFQHNQIAREFRYLLGQ